MTSSLDSIASMQDQKARMDAYRSVLASAVSSASVGDLRAFIDHMLSDSVPLVISRQLLGTLAQEMPRLPNDVFKEVADYTLAHAAPRLGSFEEQVTAVREALASLQEREENWSAAAQTLAGIDLDSGMRQLDAEYRLAKNVKISMLYLEDDDAVAAETYIKKASSLVTNCKEEGLELQYKSCYVRILDAKRRFVEAAQRYHQLSQMQTTQVSEGELLEALGAAVICCILAKPSPQRSRVLANLYKDERTASLPTFPFMEKVYLERVLRPAEVTSFGDRLKPHQRATLPDGTTVLEAAVVEHNLAAAAKLYNNMYLEELGTLLGVSRDRAEAVASKMICEDRLKGSIDQVEGLIHFNTGSERLLQWDAQIQDVCSTLNDILDGAAARGLTTV